MKRGVGRSLLFTLSGQWLAVIWSVAFFPLLFFQSISQQGAGCGCSGLSGPRGQWGLWQRRRLAEPGQTGAATPPSPPGACHLVNALTCGFARYLLSCVRMAWIQKSTPGNFFMRSDLLKVIKAKKREKLRAKDNATSDRMGKCTAALLRLVFLIRNDRHKTSLWIFNWTAFEQP